MTDEQHVQAVAHHEARKLRPFDYMVMLALALILTTIMLYFKERQDRIDATDKAICAVLNLVPPKAHLPGLSELKKAHNCGPYHPPHVVLKPKPKADKDHRDQDTSRQRASTHPAPARRSAIVAAPRVSAHPSVRARPRTVTSSPHRSARPSHPHSSGSHPSPAPSRTRASSSPTAPPPSPSPTRRPLLPIPGCTIVVAGIPVC